VPAILGNELALIKNMPFHRVDEILLSEFWTLK
jgi:hypothetical protein